MSRWMIAAAAAVLWTTLPVAARPLLANGSSISFTASQMNVPMAGRFKRFAGNIDFDPAKPATSSIQMTVDIASVSINEEADPEVVKPEWLDAAGHPQARFVSSAIKPLGGNRYQATGTLSIKGVSHPLTVPVDYREQPGGNAAIDGQFTLKRVDYKVGEGEWSQFDVVANDVLVKFHLLLGPAAKP